MRAGNLDRVIEIQRRTAGLDLYGAPVENWTTFATMRAELLQNAVADRESMRGSTTEKMLTFRMRWIDGLTLESAVCYKDKQFRITHIKEIGRRVGMDIVCERVSL